MRKVLISFSGGRTSAMMTKYMLDNFKDKYEMIVVFANTGKERKETLDFVNECDINFGFNCVWVEADIIMNQRKGTGHKVVSYETASRNGEPFENLIRKYDMPSKSAPHCTRELKLRPIRSYAKSLGWRDYDTAIGIRSDEPKRLNWDRKKKDRLIYFAEMSNVTKSDVNNFWSKQSFDLQLKSYEGNCDLCFKKSLRKLMTIVKDNPELANWWRDMEKKYENSFQKKNKEKYNPPYRFYREKMTIDDIIEESKFDFNIAVDESKLIDAVKQSSFWDSYLDTNDGCTESCELF